MPCYPVQRDVMCILDFYLTMRCMASSEQCHSHIPCCVYMFFGTGLCYIWMLCPALKESAQVLNTLIAGSLKDQKWALQPDLDKNVQLRPRGGSFFTPGFRQNYLGIPGATLFGSTYFTLKGHFSTCLLFYLSHVGMALDIPGVSPRY